MTTISELSDPRRERYFLWALSGIQFTHILDFMIMMPLGPQLIDVLGIDTAQFGWLLSSYTFSAAASGLLAATYIDRFDRRKLALTLYVLFILATLFCGLATDYATLLTGRLLAGAFGGVLSSVVQTMVADAIPFERRGEAVGTVMAAFALSTVAGVPLGLFLATYVTSLGWRAPFIFIVLLAMLVLALGYRHLPSMTEHLGKPRDGNVFQQIFTIASDRNHMRAFALIGLLVFSGFTVIPYFALYMTTNVGADGTFVAVLYLCGGAATFFTSRLVGTLADRHGKLRVYRVLVWLAFIPILATTHMGPLSWPLVVINGVLFFVLLSGRWIPGMAMVTAAAAPAVRGTFMSLVSTAQMTASGGASLVAGMIVTRTASGTIEHYDLVGYIAVACGLATLWVVRHLKVAPAEK